MKICCVCTGNTCRSPMLACLLAEALRQAGRDEVRVESAGTAAAAGDPANSLAVAVMLRRGLNLSGHRSRPLGEVALSEIDLFVCMSPRHADSLLALGLAGERILVLASARGGVPDPYGQDEAVYEATAEVLAEAADDICARLPAADHSLIQAQARARAAIDEIHRQDPAGQELAYADRCEAWAQRLRGGHLQPIELLAARCQHLGRWRLPRSSAPADRAGYLQWRARVHVQQGELAFTTLCQAGIDPALAAQVRDAVAKQKSAGALTQLLEDCACLIFLDQELASFAAEHPDYDEDKWLRIIRKTWAKMSESARLLALHLDYPPDLKELVSRAVA